MKSTKQEKDLEQSINEKRQAISCGEEHTSHVFKRYYSLEEVLWKLVKK